MRVSSNKIILMDKERSSMLTRIGMLGCLWMVENREEEPITLVKEPYLMEYGMLILKLKDS